MANQNMTMTLGFKGTGKPNGVPAYNPTGVYTLGGVQASADTQVMYFGIVVSSDPVGDDGVFYAGAEVIAGVASVFDFSVDTAPTADGNIVMDGVVVAILDADTVDQVATKIRAATYPRWTVTGATHHAIFTAKAATVYTAPTHDMLATGAVVTHTTTTAGTVGTVQRGITLYRPDIAMNDPAKPSYVLQGAPLTVAYFGPVWIGTWGKLGAAAIDPVVGCLVVANNTTGLIEFVAAGGSAGTGYTLLSNCKVISVSTDTNGALIFVNI